MNEQKYGVGRLTIVDLRIVGVHTHKNTQECNHPPIATRSHVVVSVGRIVSYQIKAAPSSEGLGFDSACPPFRTQLHVTTSLSTGGGPVSYVQLSEGGFQVVYPPGLWSRSSGDVKVLYGYG